MRGGRRRFHRSNNGDCGDLIHELGFGGFAAPKTLGARQGMQRADGRPIEVFYLYSHDDEDYRKKLGKHLSVLRRAGLITDWHDRDIDAGAAWEEEIDRHLLSADIVLLLVSASFIASHYCRGDAMTKALARHKEKKALEMKEKPNAGVRMSFSESIYQDAPSWPGSSRPSTPRRKRSAR